jgi:cytochrome c-type biogenesis protein CcmH
MTGWLIAFGLAALVLAALLLARLPRLAWEVTAAALLLGLAGYAWQGHPGLAGAPRNVADAKEAPFDEKLVERRRGLAERYGPAAQWMLLSDSFGRRGLTKEAANVLLSGLRDDPRDQNLWLGLGNALTNHMGGVVSPAADFAYRQAIAIAPDDPAPRYFYGLALAQTRQFREAREQWAPLAARLPADSQIGKELRADVARIDAMLDGAGQVPQ